MCKCRKRVGVKKNTNKTTAGQPIHTTLDLSLSGKELRNRLFLRRGPLLPTISACSHWGVSPSRRRGKADPLRWEVEAITRGRGSQWSPFITFPGDPKCVRLQREGSHTPKTTWSWNRATQRKQEDHWHALINTEQTLKTRLQSSHRPVRDVLSVWACGQKPMITSNYTAAYFVWWCLLAVAVASTMHLHTGSLNPSSLGPTRLCQQCTQLC